MPAGQQAGKPGPKEQGTCVDGQTQTPPEQAPVPQSTSEPHVAPSGLRKLLQVPQ